MLERKKINLNQRNHHHLHKMLSEMFSLWEQGYRLPDPRETKDKGDWPRIGMGGKDQITLIKEVVEGTPKVAEKPTTDIKEKEAVKETDIEVLKVRYKELSGKGTNIKDPEKLQAKIDELEASKA